MSFPALGERAYTSASMLTCSNCGRENADDARFCQSCGRPLVPAEPPREARKVVTVLFADVTGSTGLGERLDPETMRRVMGRYFEEMKAALEAHGGTVEKFIGDAVMAVFGIPVLHEDDALRAVRAAMEMRERLVRLNQELDRDRGVAILTRTGINTGEVVAGDPATGQTLVTGDAVNVAARLEQSAAPGEVLLGEATFRVLRDAVTAEVVPPLTLKGKEAPVSAYRLVDVHPEAEAIRRTLDSPMVGRDRQLALLRQTFDTAVADRACHLFTVLGSPGVGKSRLVHEFVAAVRGEARVLRGRCLPYGDGITYWPVAEIVREAAAIEDGDASDAAQSKIAGLVTTGEREAVADRLTQALGLAEATAPAEEIAWAFRKLVEALARDRPVVAVFDDIQWAEPTLLDLIDHVADWTRDAPVLVVAIARQELLDVRSGWSGGKDNATTLRLEPLPEQDCEVLVENLLGMALLPLVAKARIAEAAEGNPLFVEQVLSMLIDDELLRRDNGHWVPTADLTTIPIPPNIHALLGARLDRLGGDERQVIERASVVGKVFYQGAVSELAPEPLRPAVGSHLMTLVRKDLIRPDEGGFGAEPTFRFRHILIRDAAYAGMPKETRAALHEGFAGWLERSAGERLTEYEEIVGYHLGEAHRYRLELGSEDQHARSLADRAAQHLTAAGRRAMNRSDLTAAERLLSRAVDLLPVDSPERDAVQFNLGQVLTDLGEYARADAVAEELRARARVAGDDDLDLRVQLLQAVRSDRTAAWQDLRELADRAVDRFTGSGDDLGLFYAHWLRGAIDWTNGRAAAAEPEIRQALEHAKRAGLHQLTAQMGGWLAAMLVWGPTPAREGLRRAGEMLREFASNRSAEGSLMITSGVLHAMLGEAEEARASAAQGRSILEDLSPTVFTVMRVGGQIGLVEQLLGNLEGAAEVMRPALKFLIEMEDKGFLSTLAPQLGRVVALQGKLDESQDLARMGRENSPPDDWASQVLWRICLALALAGRGEAEQAERLAREAVALCEGVDYLFQMGEAWSDLGHVLRLAGKTNEAAALRQALALWEAKENLVGVARVREELAALGGTS
jgi:class 3 adenylate cyclase/tetratricopeptide (TPR) repeat protein